jgi:hypothetical protein
MPPHLQFEAVKELSMNRLLASVVATSGLAFYGWHTLGQGSEPHYLWLLIGAIVFLFGLWFALAPTHKTANGKLS